MIDLHRHLEGSFRPATVAELTGRDEEQARRLIQLDEPVASLVEYLRCNDRAVEALVDLDACARVARTASIPPRSSRPCPTVRARAS